MPPSNSYSIKLITWYAFSLMYYRDELENRPLHYAAAADNNSEQLVAMLIDAGADINPKNSFMYVCST